MLRNESIDRATAAEASPGGLAGFVLRHTPLPFLIRACIEASPTGGAEFWEDHLLPENAHEALERFGVPAPGRGEYFLHDRAELRYGIVVGKRSPLDGRQRAARFQTELEAWLKSAGRNRRQYRIFNLFSEEIFPNRFVYTEPLLLIIWTAERSPIERWLGGRPRATLPFLPEERATPARAPEPPPAVVPEQRPLVPERPEIERSSMANGVEPIVHRVVGTTRSGPHRRFYLRKENDRVKLAMLSSEHGLTRDFAMAFFDQVQFSKDLIRAHRGALRAARDRMDGISSFSLEILHDGRFQCLTRDACALYWRRSAGRGLVLRPTGQEPAGYRIFRGHMVRGDVLLVLPGRFALAEWRELADRLKKFDPWTQADKLTDGLGAWLDYQGRGRALLIGYDGRKAAHPQGA
ncbi:MAG: hypothetical protein H7A21_04485 [Spirochaetales bacterium]|nr:hypothetical protein [Leptospiraceae bacterium]MCP5480672.1 hypothetical protein [Spirochaetales bacterium]MCP5484024.1 hypothetical protein [Spirochaetales bacterium]